MTVLTGGRGAPGFAVDAFQPKPSRSPKALNRTLNITVVIGVRVEPELKRRLDQLALSLGKSRSTCVREAIALYLERFSGGEEARRQSQLIRQQTGSTHWSEQIPDWTDWTA